MATENAKPSPGLLFRSGRKVLAVVLVLLLLMVLTVAGGVATLLATNDGRTWLLAGGARWLHYQWPEWQLKMSGLDSPLPGRWSIRLAEIYRNDRLWISVRQLQLDFDWRALFEQQIRVHRLYVEQVDIVQPVEQDEPRSPAPASDAPASDVSLGQWSVQLEDLKVSRLHWQPAGDANAYPDYQFSGSLAFPAPSAPLQVSLNASSLPDQTGSPVMMLSVLSTLSADQAVTVSGQLHEPAGGLIARTLSLPAGQAVAVDFSARVTTRPQFYLIALEHFSTPWLDTRCHFQGQWRIARDFSSVELASGLLTIDEKAQQLSGVWHDGALSAVLDLDQFPLQTLSPWLTQVSKGWLSGQYQIDSDFNDWNVSGQGSFEAGLHFRDQAQDLVATIAGRAQASYAGQRLELKNAALSLRQPDQRQVTAAQAQGFIDFGKQTVQLKGHLEALGTARIESALGLAGLPWPDQLASLQATLKEADVTLSGDISNNWRATKISATAIASGHYQNIPVSLDVAANGYWQRFRVTRGKAGFDQARLSLEGDIDIEGANNRLAISLAQLDLAALNKLGLSVPEQLTGSLSAGAELSGSLLRPQGHFAAHGQLQYPLLNQAGEPERQSVQLQLRGTSQGDTVLIEQLQLDLLGAAKPRTLLSADGQIKLGSPMPAIQGQFQTRALPMTLLTPYGWPDGAGVLDAQLSLAATAGEQLDADWISLLQLGGRLDYRSVVNQRDPDGEIQSRPIRLKAQIVDHQDAKTWALHSALFTGPEQTKVGRLELTMDKSSVRGWSQAARQLPRIEADSEVDLSSLNFLLKPGQQIAGRFKGQLSLAGTLDRPDLDGRFDLDEGAVTVNSLGLVLKPITLKASAHQQTVVIEQFDAADGGKGMLTASGQVSWANPDSAEAVDLAIKARQMMMVRRSDIDGLLDGSLTLTGSLKELLLAGQIEVSPLSASIEGNVGSDIPEIEVQFEQSPDAQTAPSWWPVLTLDLIVLADQQAYVRGRGLDAELKGRLKVVGPVSNLDVDGKFKTVRGTFEIFGKKFELEKGEVGFSNNAVVLQIIGVYKKGDIEVRAELAGTGDNLTLTLTSTPELPEDEILARLIFGRSVTQMTAIQAVQLAAAINKLRGGGGFDPIASTRDLLGIDTLTVDTEETDQGTGVSVGAGKYLTERVYLEVERSPEPTRPWRGSIEIELTPSISLKSTTGGGSEGEGVELQWSHDY